MSDSNAKSNKRRVTKNSLEDNELIKKAKSGDQGAYRKLMEKYKRALFFHIRKMTKDHEIIEDLVQESFTKAFDNLNSYNTDYAFSTWLYRIATNHTIDYLRKKKLKTVSIDKKIRTKEGEMEMNLPDQESKTDRKIIRDQRKQIIQHAIKNLPDKYQRVIELRHMESYSYQEIADELDMPLGTVKAHIFRARELLYKALKDKRHTF